MSQKNKVNQKGQHSSATSTTSTPAAPAQEVMETVETSQPAAESEVEVVVTENAPMASTEIVLDEATPAEATPAEATPAESTPAESTPAVEEVKAEAPAAITGSIVPTAAPIATLPKVRLFWQKTCEKLKESTNTEIKKDEVFTKTPHQVYVLPEGVTVPVVNTVYSMKRGKRIYYTPSSYLTADMLAAADAKAEVTTKEKAEVEAKKKAEAAKKEADKAAKTAGQPKVVAPSVVAPSVVAPSVVAPAVAEAVVAQVEEVVEVAEDAI